VRPGKAFVLTVSIIERHRSSAFFDRSSYNQKDPQRFLQQVIEFEHMLDEDGVTLIKFWFAISKEESAGGCRRQTDNPVFSSALLCGVFEACYPRASSADAIERRR
jgi:hypothetical protein